MSAADNKAVFLSYASQDSEAAKRICEALRSAGVEVWFDQNELVGGDAWDQKIRKQIGSCALFIPIISASTQARAEGYFRLEWRLADKRTELMGKAKTFLLPVCIDDTRDSEADVPDSFLAVQWMRLKGGEVSPSFVARVQKLLSSELELGRPRPEMATRGEVAAPPKRRSPTWLVPAAIAAALAAAGGWYAFRPSAPLPPASSLPPAASQSDPSPASPRPVVALSPARQLVSKAAQLHDQLGNPSRGDLELAEQFCQQAVALDPNDGEVWAEYSLVISNFIATGYDRSSERKQAVRSYADKSVKLAPSSLEAQFALATSYRWQDATQDEAIRLLRELVERMPGDRRVLRALGNALRLADKNEEALLYFSRAAALPGGDPLALFQRAMALSTIDRDEEAIASLDESLALHPGAAAFVLKVFLLVNRGELATAQATLDKTPTPFLVEDRGALAAYFVNFRQRKWDQALNALLAVPRDYFNDNFYTGPKGMLTGDVRFYAGLKVAAELDWKAALKLVDQHLADTGASHLWHLRKAELHARLRQAEEADRSLHAYRELQGSYGRYRLAPAQIDVHLNRLEAAIQFLQQAKLTRENLVYLRDDPEWDPLRRDPRFQALLKQLVVSPKPATQATSSTVQLPVDAKSVAVLAFANLSDDKANEYFSDGISEELLNVLAKVPGLKVTARTSAFYFKGKEVPIPEIAKQLGVAYVVEGSVRKAGDKVRITAQLIKAADGFHVWSDTFTRDLKDVFAVQDEIAGLIAQQLQLKLGGTSRVNQLVNPEAYDLYLRARALSRLEDENYLPIIKLYEAAVAKDPDFALAYVQLSLARASDYWSGGLDSKPAARAALQAAQRLAPDAPETRLAAGSYAYSCENDWNLARTEFLAAEAGLPGDAQVAFFLGMVQRRLLSFDESIRQVARATELDPTDRNNFAQQAHTLKALRRYPELVDLTAAALKRFPADENFLQVQAIALREIERDQAAYVRRVRELPAGEARAQVLKDYFLALNAGEWEAAGRILADSKLEYVPNTPASTKDPVALQQAMLAHLQGRTEQAQRLGAEAVAYYQAQHWSLRQDKWLQLGRALALAYAGRGTEAMGLARETLAATALRDPWDTVILHTSAAQVYLVAGHRDEALAELRIMMSGPCLQGAEELRRDPLWRTVKDDPRFEEILRSAKRL